MNSIPDARPAVASKPDRRSFEDFYRSEYAPAVRLAWLLTGSVSAAEDVVQDVMVSLHGRYRRVRCPVAYLRRAVVKRGRKWQRDERRQRERVQRFADATTVSLTPPPETELPDKQLLGAVAALPYRQRVVIVGRYWGDWSEQELAQALGCRPGTIKSLASRALQRLRVEVGKK